MSENTTGFTAKADTVADGNGSCCLWWKKVLDWEEAKNQILFALPMMLTNVAYYCIPLVSAMFAGHLGEPEFAAANLANSWANVTGLSFMVGLSGSLETLCGQGFGAKIYRMLGIYLQSSCLISMFFCILISILWFFTEPILILLHQEPEIAKLAALYIKYLVPGLFAYGLLNNILRFLQTQSIVAPLLLCSLVPFILHIGITYVLVHYTSLSFIGAPIAVSISLWIAVIMLAGYVIFTENLKETWQGFSKESFEHVLSSLKLALPSAAMMCLEFWAFELLVLLAGILPNSKITTSLIAMCLSTEAIAYMFTYGLNAAASTRVSNELGAKNINKAKQVMAVTLKLSIILALGVVLALGFAHNIWAGLFSDSPTIINKYASMTPLLLISIILDSVQGVLLGLYKPYTGIVMLLVPIPTIMTILFGPKLQEPWIGAKIAKEKLLGPKLQESAMHRDQMYHFTWSTEQTYCVARGCGWQHLVVYINLASFYLIGMPVAVALAFLVKLYAKGLWIGLTCGLLCQTGSLLFLVCFKKWTRVELKGSDNHGETIHV